MRSKLARICGIGLVLVLLISMLTPAAPVSAGTLSWTQVNTPNPTNEQLRPGSDVSFLFIAPDGRTMFAWDGANLKLLKSIDAGINWTGTNVGIGLDGVVVSALAISSDYANDQIVVAAGATTDIVYRSIDGGQTFGAMPAIPGLVGATDTIRSVAVGNWYRGGQGILVGYADGAGTGGAALFTTLDPTWVDLTFIPGWIPADVNAVAFSRNHTTDAQILMVASTAANGTFLRSRLALNNWDVDVSPVPLVSDTAGRNHAAATLRARIVFPADYNWQPITVS